MEEGEGSATPLCTKRGYGGERGPDANKVLLSPRLIPVIPPKIPVVRAQGNSPYLSGSTRSSPAGPPLLNPQELSRRAPPPGWLPGLPSPFQPPPGPSQGLHVEGSTGLISCVPSEFSLHGPAPRHRGATAGLFKERTSFKKRRMKT